MSMSVLLFLKHGNDTVPETITVKSQGFQPYVCINTLTCHVLFTLNFVE